MTLGDRLLIRERVKSRPRQMMVSGSHLALLGNPFDRRAFERVSRSMRAACKQRKRVSQQCQM